MAGSLASCTTLIGAAALCLLAPMAGAVAAPPPAEDAATDAPVDAASPLEREIAMVRNGRLD